MKTSNDDVSLDMKFLYLKTLLHLLFTCITVVVLTAKSCMIKSSRVYAIVRHGFSFVGNWANAFSLNYTTCIYYHFITSSYLIILQNFYC